MRNINNKSFADIFKKKNDFSYFTLKEDYLDYIKKNRRPDTYKSYKIWLDNGERTLLNVQKQIKFDVNMANQITLAAMSMANTEEERKQLEAELIQVPDYDIENNFMGIDIPFVQATKEFLYQRENKNTANQKLSQFKRLFEHVNKKKGLNKYNPFNALVLEKEKTDVKYIPSSDEINKILEYIRMNTSTVETMKHALCIILVIDTASRVQETLQLKWQNVDFENKTILLEASTTKNGYEAIKPVSYQVTMDYLEMLKQFSEDEYIFKSSGDKLINRTSIYRYLKNIVRKLGLNEGIDIHSLRRYRLDFLYNNGVPISQIRTLSCHRTSAILEKHYVKVDLDKSSNSIREASNKR